MKLTNLLLPTEKNDYTPNALQKIALVPIALLILLSFAVVNLQALFWLSSDWLVGAVLPAVIVDLTNKERMVKNEQPLKRNVILDRAATLKAEDMAKNAYFAHQSPAGLTPWYWFDVVAYDYAHAGENLAIHFSDSSEVVEAWMNSPLHRDNIINKDYQEIGVGTARGNLDGFATVFVVQLFGTPASTVQPEISTIEPNTDIISLTKEPIELNNELKGLASGKSIETNHIPFGEVEGESIKITNESVLTLPGDKDAPNVSSVPLAKPEVLNNSAQTFQKNKIENDTSVSKATESFVLSSFVSTSSGLVPASLEYKSEEVTNKTTGIGSIVTKPNTILQIIYLIVGIVLALLLLTSIVVGARHHRPMQIVYGLSLLLLMSGLFYVHTSLTAGVMIEAERKEISR